VTEFQATVAEQVAALHRAQLPQPALPLHLWAADESRFGLQTVQRRRLTLRGVKPIGRYQHEFANFYVYGAVAPRTGDGYFAAHAAFNAATFEDFVTALGAAHPATFNVLLVDNARVHHAKDLRLPANVALLFQPPYAPELNPTERVWLALKDTLAWRPFDKLSALQEALAVSLEALDAPSLQSLTTYPYLIPALHAQAA
jgi:hypothetical protein